MSRSDAEYPMTRESLESYTRSLADGSRLRRADRSERTSARSFDWTLSMSDRS